MPLDLAKIPHCRYLNKLISYFHLFWWRLVLIGVRKLQGQENQLQQRRIVREVANSAIKTMKLLFIVHDNFSDDWVRRALVCSTLFSVSSSAILRLHTDYRCAFGPRLPFHFPRFRFPFLRSPFPVPRFLTLLASFSDTLMFCMAPLKCIADNFLWICSPNLFPSSGLSIGVNHRKNEKKRVKR